MERFKITVNDVEKTIGLNGLGVLSATVFAVTRSDATRECKLELGGLESLNGTSLKWGELELQVGDKIVIEVLPPGDFDHPEKSNC